MLPRDTEWRQGSTLTKDSSCALGLIENSSGKCCVVISHDCDLPHEKEPLVPDHENLSHLG
jgi:hypothetical protein